MLKTSFTIAPVGRRPGVSPAAALLFLALSWGCGGDSSPTTPAPTPAPPPAPTTPTTPTPPPDPEPAQPDTATYTFVQPDRLIGSSNSTTTPAKLPEGVNLHGELAMFLHSRDWTPFVEGEPASDGLKTLAETGEVKAFLDEAEAAGAEVQFRTQGQLFELFFRPDPSIEVTIEKPCMSYAQQIEPSPDWFVGWSTACATDEAGRWRDTVTTEMIAFDAGTADGPSFQAKTADTEPRFAVTQLDLRELLGITAFPAVFQRITANRKTE